MNRYTLNVEHPESEAMDCDSDGEWVKYEDIKKFLTADSAEGAEVTLDCGVSCPAVDEEMLARAMKKAVEVGLLPKWADTEGYLKNWDGMKEVLQAAVGN